MDSQELRNLSEAYMSVYQLDEISPEFVLAASKAADKKGKPAQASRLYKKFAARDQAANYAAYQRSSVNKEEVDIYDVILSHLIDEGYASTEEAATAIMVNMSEEWRDSVVEAIEQLDEISDKMVIAARNKLAKRTDRSVSALSRRDSFINDTNREGRMNTKIQSRNKRTGSNVEPTFLRRHE
jgi:hypothetical protein